MCRVIDMLLQDAKLKANRQNNVPLNAGFRVAALRSKHLRACHCPLCRLFRRFILHIRGLLSVVAQGIIAAFQRDFLPICRLDRKFMRRDFADVCAVQTFLRAGALLPERIEEIPHLLHDLPILLRHILMQGTDNIKLLPDTIEHTLSVRKRPPVHGKAEDIFF